jgi:NADPH-dependent 2,4-dienoyl-CoA reductase/sulfur reductase-like enzyme
MIPSAVDVLVVGAGPAGIAAGVHAAEAGRSVLLLDESPHAGGQIWRHAHRAALPHEAQRWLHRLDAAGAQLLTGASAFDAPRPGELAVLHAGNAFEIRYAELVVAAGARELLLPFPGWTLPGVLGVGGVQALLKSGLDVRGRNVVVAGSGPLLLPVAALLARRGAHVLTVAEQASRRRVAAFALSLGRSPAKAVEALRFRTAFTRTPYRTGTWVKRALGDPHVTGAVLTNGEGEEVLACDLLCVGYGLVPETRLAQLLGCALQQGRVVVDAQQRTSVPHVWCVGEPTGIAGAEAALLGGTVAGRAIAGGSTARSLRSQARAGAFASRLADAFALRLEVTQLAGDDTIVCRCEDVPMAAVRRCAGMREAKLYTRAGMGACQGRVCGSALEHLCGWQPDRVRAPLIPVPVSAMYLTTTEEN